LPSLVGQISFALAILVGPACPALARKNHVSLFRNL
jgi:hypothetical protein